MTLQSEVRCCSNNEKLKMVMVVKRHCKFKSGYSGDDDGDDDDVVFSCRRKNVTS